MNYLLAEIFAGSIVIIQICSIDLWGITRHKFFMYFGMAWTIVIMVLLWIMFIFNKKIIDGFEESVKC